MCPGIVLPAIERMSRKLCSLLIPALKKTLLCVTLWPTYSRHALILILNKVFVTLSLLSSLSFYDLSKLLNQTDGQEVLHASQSKHSRRAFRWRRTQCYTCYCHAIVDESASACMGRHFLETHCTIPDSSNNDDPVRSILGEIYITRQACGQNEDFEAHEGKVGSLQRTRPRKIERK